MKKPNWCGLIDDVCWSLEKGTINSIQDCKECFFRKTQPEAQTENYNPFWCLAEKTCKKAVGKWEDHCPFCQLNSGY